MKVDFKEIVKVEMDRTESIMAEYPWEDKLGYALWLAQTHCMVNYSTRLVAFAGALAPMDRNGLHERFIDHAKEERGHQLIAVSDMKVLGFTLDQLPKFWQSATMYQIQYYWIQHRGVASFFGYTLALEALANVFGPRVLERTLKAHGRQANKFLSLHVEADVGHLEEAYKAMELLNAEESKLALENLEVSSELYRQMMHKGVEFTMQNKNKKAG